MGPRVHPGWLSGWRGVSLAWIASVAQNAFALIVVLPATIGRGPLYEIVTTLVGLGLCALLWLGDRRLTDLFRVPMWQYVAAGTLLTVGFIVRLVVLDTPPAKTAASFACYLIGIPSWRKSSTAASSGTG